MTHQQPTFLIVGGSGKTGARVESRLQALGLQTRSLSRRSQTPFDWHDRTTWESALSGGTSAYVSYQPDLAVPRAADDMKVFGETAKRVGIQKVVLLSGRGEDGAAIAEKALMDSGIPTTVLRCSWFSQNFSEGFMLDGILNGNLALPAADIPEPFVDVDDIADAAVVTLTETGHSGKVYELTGPRALTFGEAVKEIGDQLGKPVAFISVPIEAFLKALEEQGLPEEFQWLMNELFSNVLDGRNAEPQAGISQILGRPARDFSAYVSQVVRTGMWHHSSGGVN